MATATALFIITLLLEFIIHMRLQRPAASHMFILILTAGAIIAAFLAMITLPFTVTGILFSVLYIYRLLNLARIAKRRMHWNYLRFASLRTSFWLIAGQSLLGAAFIYESTYSVSYGVIAAVLLMLEFMIVMVMYLTVRKRTKSDHRFLHDHHISRKDLPSVSVLIPARNESDDLQACLTTLLATDYPKLEILVLDDCSQGSRTSEIVRSFAHAGVRFVKGSEPVPTWLAKNHAYRTLAEEATGDLLLFAGVDIRFEPDAIRKLVTAMTARNVAMLSVMPRNMLHPSHMPILQPMRYAVQLMLPERILRDPPTLGSCWLIRRTTLAKAGGFAAVSRMIVPESYFARTVSSYSFVTGSSSYGISSFKSIAAQRDTAIRTSYPLLHRQPESVAAVTGITLLGCSIPVLYIVTFVLTGKYVAFALLSIIVIFMAISAYRHVLVASYDSERAYYLAGFLPAILVQLALVHYSMYKYEFDEVIWKGRNVCIPAMHVVPKLPDF